MILFILTFIFGTLRLLVNTHLFDNFRIDGPFEHLFAVGNWTTGFGKFFVILDAWAFYASLIYQTWYWFTHFNII